MLVQKYGGSSVGTPEKIKSVAARIARARAAGESVAVVVSAMGDTTDELLELAAQVTARVHDREMDVLLSAGERISMALLSMALRDLGQEAISFTGSQAGIITDESHTRARILEIKPFRVVEELKRGKVVIIAGFQGVSRTKEITTLGRGGSDTTAVALAAALGADRCEVFTDVPGIFSADPRIVKNAVRYERLPLGLVHEMASLGAQVMHARSIEIARERGFPIYVGLAHPANPQQKEFEMGTTIVPDGTALELPKIVAVTARRGLCEARFKGEAAAQALAAAAEGSVLVYQASQDASGELTLLVDPTESGAFLARFPGAAGAMRYAAVSAVGYQLQQNCQLPAQALQILKSQSISPAGLTVHPQSFSVWFPDLDDSAARAVKYLHEAFIGNKQGS